MSEFDQFAKNELVHVRAMPQSFVRPVSLDKVREHSNSKTAQQQTSAQHSDRSKNPVLQSSNEEAYNRLLNKKLIYPERRKPHFVQLQDRSKQLYQQHAVREQKRVEKAKQVQDEKLKECTFKPQIAAQRGNRRTLEEFLNSQRQHSRKAADRISTMKSQLDKEKIKQATFQPKINKIFGGGNSENACPVHQRLYQIFRQKHSQATEKQNLKENTSISKEIIKQTKDTKENSASMQIRPQTRKQSAHTLVSPMFSQQLSHQHKQTLTHNPSNQSLRTRQSGQHRTRQPSSGRKKGIQNLFQPSISTSISSQKQLIHKLMKQMCMHCHELDIKSNRISYLQLGDLMVMMNFIKEEASGNLNERRSLFQIWEMLNGEVNQFVTLQNLLKVVCSIIGIHSMRLVEKEMEESEHQIFRKKDFALYSSNQSKSDRKINLGNYDGQVLNIDDKQSRSIKKLFQNLYVTKLNYENHSKKYLHQESSFKPEISEISKELAERHRIRILQETSELIKNRQIDFSIPENGEISHADLLLIQKKATQAKIRQKKFQKQERQHEKAPSQRTEKSTILENSTRYLDLYALSINKGTRRDRTADEIDVEKYKNQLTFKPNTYREKPDTWQPVAKDVDKAIYRMYEGRRMKQQKLGEPKSCSKDEASQRTPLLYLNVNIDNTHSQRLSVYEDDDPSSLAEHFGSRFKLNHEAKTRLCELIRSEIRDLLCKIPPR